MRYIFCRAFWLGLFEHIKFSDMGRTWADDADNNEAYDTGWNLADKLTRRG